MDLRCPCETPPCDRNGYRSDAAVHRSEHLFAYGNYQRVLLFMSIIRFNVAVTAL